jgi:adenosylhomocysteine nucleosidase
MRAAAILALKAEAKAACGGLDWRDDRGVFHAEIHLADGASIRWIQSGLGPARAAQAASQAMAEGAEIVVSLGVSGGLDPTLAPGDLVLASEVLELDGARFEPSPASARAATALAGLLDEEAATVRTGPVLTSPAPVLSVRGKAKLFRQSKALCVDMESAAAARAAHKAGRPFLCVRIISDPASRNLPRLAVEVATEDGGLSFARLARGILAKPWDIWRLAQTGREFGAAKQSLALAGCALQRLAMLSADSLA